MSKKLKQKSPKLRFSEFNEDWETKKLEELTDWSSGGTPAKDNSDYWNGDIPWISASSMYYDLLVDSDRRVTKLGLDNGSRLAPKNSILILVRGSILYNRIPVGITGRDLAFNQDVKALQVSDVNDVKYLFHWLKAKESLLKSKVSGTGIGAGKLDTSEIKALVVLKPSAAEQKKIADFLDAIATHLTQLRRKHDLLQTYKRGVIQKIFCQQIRFKQADGLDFPAWEKEDFGTIVDKASSKYDPTTDNTDYPCVELESIASDEGNIIKVFSSREQQSIKSKFKSGDVLFGKLRPYLRKFVYAHFEGVCSTEIWVLRGKKVSDKYLYYLVQTDRFHKISNVSFGSKMPRSDWDFVSSSPFAFPSFKEQESIADFLTAIDAKVEAVMRQIEGVEKFKQGLLQKMFV